MTESQLVRLQADIVKEINQYEGGSFSERFRNWKNQEIIQRIEELDSSNDMLTDILENVLDRTVVNKHNELEVR